MNLAFLRSRFLDQIRMQKAVTVALLNPKAKAIISLWPLQYRLSLTRKSSLRPAPWIARRRDMAQVALVTKEKRSLTALTHLSRNPQLLVRQYTV
jgi:hypothetical protein